MKQEEEDTAKGYQKGHAYSNIVPHERAMKSRPQRQRIDGIKRLLRLRFITAIGIKDTVMFLYLVF